MNQRKTYLGGPDQMYKLFNKFNLKINDRVSEEE